MQGSPVSALFVFRFLHNTACVCVWGGGACVTVGRVKVSLRLGKWAEGQELWEVQNCLRLTSERATA